jgi:hypothetical protein
MPSAKNLKRQEQPMHIEALLRPGQLANHGPATARSCPDNAKFYRAQSTVFVYPRSMDRLRLIRLNPAGFGVFDGLVCTHWGGRHEVGAGTCQGFTNR